MYTFGVSREAFKKVVIKGATAQGEGAPGPGSYDTRGATGKEAQKYSMRPKTASNKRKDRE